MAGDDTPEVGDKVSWSHGGSHPSGEVAEKKTDGELAIQSKRGNTIKAKGSHDDPAVHLARSGNDVVKKQSALEVDEKGSGSATDGAKSKAEDSKADEDKGLANGDKAPKSAKKAEKRKAPEEDAGEETPAKKSRGRPKQDKAETPAKEKKTPKKAVEKKEKTPKKAAAAAAANGDKKPRGRPKKDGSAPTKSASVKKSKAKAPPVKGSVGTRTRSTK